MRPYSYLIFVIAHLQIISVCVSQRSVGDRCSGSGGTNGVCQLITNCSSAQDDVRKGIRPINCGFQGREPIVCCPESAPTKSRIPGEAAEQECREYRRLCERETTSSDVRPIAGGQPASSLEFPHMAAIGYGDETDIRWSCGGTLISEKFVLTAAHCMRSAESGPAKWVLLGAIKLINTTATNSKDGQIHPITRRIRHPEYKSPAKYNDIALFEIGPAVTPDPLSLNSKELHPACLAYDGTSKISQAIATGWGKVGHFDDGSSHLLKVTLDVFEPSVCQEAYDAEIKSTTQLRDGIANTMLCAGVLEGKRDTCQGDSGGPLQIPIMYSCLYEVLGVTSFGKVCAFPNSPSVYTKVLEYVPWIEDILWPA